MDRYVSDDREHLIELYRTALDAAAPGPALANALAREGGPEADRVWIIALGKAAYPLATEAVAQLAASGREPTGGLVVGIQQAPSPHPSLATAVGDHPLPGPRSLEAAEAVERAVREVALGDEVWILLSGGTSSLIASPVRGLTLDDVRATFELLLASGLDIASMNRVRKRTSRWAAGRLAQVLAHAKTRVFIVSDVVGDDIATIGSGPCSPDPTRAIHVRALLTEAGLEDRVPAALLDLLDRTDRGMAPETPKPGDAAFRDVRAVIIANNRVALRAVAAKARELGWDVRVRRKQLRGEAARLGERIAHKLLAEDVHATVDGEPAAPLCILCGGEATVSLDEDAGTGGRCQELALAAARVLHGVNDRAVTLLAAGTDGRDGPTDAAGAIVDASTWSRIAASGRDPQQDLERHDTYAALDAAGALLRTGVTGTNVMDVLFAIIRPS